MSDKQSITGFTVNNWSVKQGKEGEVVTLTLKADGSTIKAGDKEIGDVMKALLVHLSSGTEVGLVLFFE